MEADPAAVNLDGVRAFFNERRPFFVEGSGVFRFDIDCNDGACTGLLYSRRIGRAPQVEPDSTDDEYAAGRRRSTILGAAKLTGRDGGVLGRRAERGDAGGARDLASGLERTENVGRTADASNVLRARREFADRSKLGAMLTSANRRITRHAGFLPTAP